MKLYTFPPSPNSIKVMALIHQLGLEVEVEVLDLTKGESKTEEFQKINPNGMIPTLVDGDFILWESNAILRYLAEKHNSPLMPESLEQKAHMEMWMCWQLAHWGDAVGTVVFERVAPNFFPDHVVDEKALAKGLENIERFAKVLDAHLADRKFVLGDQVSLADLSLASLLVHKEMGQLPVDQYSHMMAWFGRVMELPYFQKALPQMPVGA